MQEDSDNRAARILLTRQTYMMSQAGIARGELPGVLEPEGHRREKDNTESTKT